MQELFENRTPAQQASVLQKLIKSYDPGLAEDNKEKLKRLFAHLLNYINHIFSNLKEEMEVKNAFAIFSKLAPYIYDLAHTSKVITKKYLMDVITEKYNNFKKFPRRVPDLDTLIFFKLVSLIYPTSDFRHPVTTPCFVFMTEILRRCRFRDVFSISRGLFVVTLILEYTILSKRYVPASINFLRGILYLSANTSIINPIQLVPPFRIHKEEKILVLKDDCSKMVVDDKMVAKDFVNKMADDDFKIRSLATSVGMLREYFDMFNDIEAQLYIFDPHIQLLNRIDHDLYPKKVSSKIQETLQYMKESLEVKTFTPLAPEKKRPKALKLYEPDIQEV